MIINLVASVRSLIYILQQASFSRSGIQCSIKPSDSIRAYIVQVVVKKSLQFTSRKVVIASSMLQCSAFCSSAVDGGRNPGLRVRCPELSSKSYSSCLNLESDINNFK